MSQTILINNAPVILPGGRALTNLFIKDGIIVSVDAAPTVTANEVIDAKGQVLFPGLIDDEVGYDADLVLVDPNQIRTIENEKQYTKSKWSPWAGESLRGWPTRVFVGGRTVYHNGNIVAERPAARLQFDHTLGGFWKTQNGVGSRCRLPGGT